MSVDLKVDEETTSTELGVDMFVQLGENLHLAEKEVNAFMANLIGCTPAEFSNMTLSESKKYIEEFKALPGVDDFFKLAGGLMKSK